MPVTFLTNLDGNELQQQLDSLRALLTPGERAEIRVSAVDGCLLAADDSPEELAGHHVRYTERIPVLPGDRFSLVAYNAASENHPNIFWYDREEKLLSWKSLFTEDLSRSPDRGCLLVTVPPGAYFVRFAAQGNVPLAELDDTLRNRFEVLHLPRENEERSVSITGYSGGYFGERNEWYSVEGMSARRSDPMAVQEGDVFLFTGFFYEPDNASYASAMWYGADGVIVEITNSTGSQLRLSPPAGAVLVRFIAYSYSPDPNDCVLSVALETRETSLKQLQQMNCLYGKKYVACGDSFTAGPFPEKTEESWDEASQSYKTYCWHIASRNGMKLVNEAQSGSTMHNNGQDNAFCLSRCQALPADADYITLCFGLNETEAAIGTLADTGNDTVMGAWNLVLEYLIAKLPYAKIGIIIPDAWCSAAMREALIAVAEYWGIPYLDLSGDGAVPLLIGGRRGGPELSPRAIELRNEAFQISPEDSHPNPRAHAYRSTIIENFMRSL